MTRLFRYLMPAAVMVAALFGGFAAAPAALAQSAPGQAQELAYVELTGVIEALDIDTMLVGWWEVDYSGAELNTALELGAAVKVEGYLLADGVIWALEVDALEDDTLGETELTGTLAALDDVTAEVAGLLFDVTGAELEDGVAVGDLVEVHATHDATGALIAREIDLVDLEDGDDGVIDLPEDCEPTLPSGWVMYTIQSGDTLSEIADATDSSVQEIAYFNCISDPRLIVAGQVLFVPVMPDFSDDGNTNDNDDDGSNDNDDGNTNDNDDDGSNDNDDGNTNDDDDGSNDNDDGNTNDDDDGSNDNDDNSNDDDDGSNDNDDGNDNDDDDGNDNDDDDDDNDDDDEEDDD